MKRAVLLAILILLTTVPAMASNKSGVEPQVLSLPKGPGSIDGLGESFEPTLNNGTATYQVKIEVGAGVNGFQPEVALTYDSGYGNGPLGLSWSLTVPFIQRQTDKGLPHYLESDPFIYGSHGELVPLGSSVFQLKIEGLFTKFLKNGDTWEAWSKSGVHHFFGATNASRISTSRGIFKWLPDRSVDTNGNEIRYLYFQHDGNAYLREIRYAFTASRTFRSVSFEYEDRSDVISDYRSRSKVLTAKRMKNISVLSEGKLVRKYLLEYEQPPGTEISRLLRVTKLGRDGRSALPSTTFRYSSLNLTSATTVGMQNPPAVSLGSKEADLVDIDGDGLPDILYTPVSGHELYLNQGKGIWQESPVKPETSPGFSLSTGGVMMADLNGEGRSDLVVESPPFFGYFKNNGRPWEKELDWVPYETQPPFSLENPDTRLVDINNDGLIDVVFSGQTRLVSFINHKDASLAWTESVQTPNPGLSFSDAHVQLADLNGDKLEDLVYLDSRGYIYYLPSTGFGSFDEEVFMTNSPTLPEEKILNSTILLMDVNNDGFADLIQVDSTQVTVWLNRGNNGFSPPHVILGAPSFNQDTPILRQADMNGDGCRDLLFSFSNTQENQRYQYLDFCRGSYPNLLTRIDNGLGRVIGISYRSSTEYYLQAISDKKPWKTKLPFPVQVVSRRVIRDNNSGQEYVTDFQYRDAYYDGNEREFRGFSTVDKIEYGDPTAPTLKTHYVFDVGTTEESRKGMVLETTTLTEKGSLNPPSGVYQRVKNALKTRSIASGINGKPVRFSFTSQTDTALFESTSSPRQLRSVFDYDNYGNEIKKFNYGLIDGANLAAGNDEILTYTNFSYITSNGQWILDRPKRIIQRNLNGSLVSDTKNTYDDRGNLTIQKKWLNGSEWITAVQNRYDNYGNITRITDANAHSRIIRYDPAFHTFPISESIEGLGLTMLAGYDLALGKLTSFTDFNRHATQFGYDVFGRLIHIIKPGDSKALPTQLFEYHLSNPVSFIRTQSREISGQAATYNTYSYFDGLGRKLQTRSEGQDGKWVVADAVTFNMRQQPKQKWLPYFSAASGYGTPDKNQPFSTTHYDPTGRIIKEVNPDGSFRTTRYLPMQKVVHDEEDNRSKGPHFGTPNFFTYDGLERLVKVAERNGAETYITKYAYDGQNNLTSIRDDHGNLKTMTFDGLGRKTFMDDPDKGQMRYGYDGVGNHIQTQDNKGQIVTYEYDAANRILTESFSGIKVHYHYDRDLPLEHPDLQNTLGRLSFVEDEAGRVSFSYDARGSITSKARKVVGTNYELTLIMAYDAMDRLTSLTYPDDMKVGYVYNPMNQLKSIPGYVTRIDYCASGQKTRFLYANGVDSTYQYDQRYRLKSLKTVKGTSTLQDLAYEYDAVSNISAITDHRTNPAPESQARSFQYDDLYRLTNAHAPNWIIDYRYDSIGNLVSQTSDVDDPKVNLGDFAYGEGSAGPHAVTKAGSFVYTYDGNGNIKTKTGYSFDFDYKDRMTRTNQVTGGLHGKYVYGYDGNRVVKTVTGNGRSETTIYADKYVEVRQGQLIEYVFAGDRRVARISKPFNAAKFGVNGLEIGSATGEYSVAVTHSEKAEDVQKNWVSDVMAGAQTSFYIPDHLGSASILTDEKGTVVEESVYYPYGMDRARRGSFESEYRFTSKELDEESEFHYFGARYYDSMVGKYLSVDPFYSESPSVNNRSESSNLYCYTTNPIRFIDPKGLFLTDAISAVSSLASVVAPAISEALDKAIGWASNTSIGKWSGERTLKYIVGDNLENADYASQAAYYGTLAEGLDKTIGVTKEATGVAMQTVTSLFTDKPQGTVSGMLRLCGILAESAGWEKTANVFNTSSEIVAVGQDIHSVYKVNKSWRSLDKIVKPDLMSRKAHKILRNKEMRNALKASSAGMNLGSFVGDKSMHHKSK